MGYILMFSIFFLGILAIALEDIIKINKAASALCTCVALWGLLFYNGTKISEQEQAINQPTSSVGVTINPTPNKDKSSVLQGVDFVERKLRNHLGDVSETIFFVLCSMLIISIVDRHGGFHAFTQYMSTDKKRLLLWFFCFASFFFSALLDNLAAAIVLLAVLQKLVRNQTDRMKYACMIIISCNAGGSWSPIGDITTLLLWTNDRITVAHQTSHLFIPALVNMLVPLLIAHFKLFRKGATLREPILRDATDEYADLIPERHRRFIFVLGISALLLIPIYQVFFAIPPFIGILIGVVFMWLYTDIMYGHIENIKEKKKLSIPRLLPDIDMTTILYFLGILMSVGALQTVGALPYLGRQLSAMTDNMSFISFLVGMISSLVDNVAMVASIMGMYPISFDAGSVFAVDGSFWTFLSYCAVTGGSLLIIGSATGVTVMGVEKIGFGYYLKRFSLLALLGYCAGAGVYLLFFM